MNIDKKVWYLIVTLLVISNVVIAQNNNDSRGAMNRVSTIITNLPKGKVYLASVQGDRYTLKDSTKVNDEKVIFSLVTSSHAGVYKLILPKSKEQTFYNRPASQLDFIYNHEDVVLRTDFNVLVNNMEVISSIENEFYYKFLKNEQSCQTKLELLYPVINYFPPDDPFLIESKNKYNAVQKERATFITDLTRTNTIASRIIKTYQSPFLDAFATESDRVQYFRHHYFDHIDFSDAALLNSSVYTDRIIRYLSLYRGESISPAEQEDEFIKAVDIVMAKVSMNPVVHEFILDYLIRGFEKFKMEKVLVHIADHYMDTDCKSGDETLRQKRMEAYKKMAIGRQAPEFNIEDVDGRNVDLYDIPNKYVLLVFWASWCPHCNTLMPELKKWYDERSEDLEVIAFSIDENSTAWKENISNNNYGWINCNDPAGWDGEVATRYNLYATPTMFLLDEERRIVAKPLSVKELDGQ